jgi:hypothetical protein
MRISRLHCKRRSTHSAHTSYEMQHGNSERNGIYFSNTNTYFSNTNTHCHISIQIIAKCQVRKLVTPSLPTNDLSASECRYGIAVYLYQDVLPPQRTHAQSVDPSSSSQSDLPPVGKPLVCRLGMNQTTDSPSVHTSNIMILLVVLPPIFQIRYSWLLGAMQAEYVFHETQHELYHPRRHPFINGYRNW